MAVLDERARAGFNATGLRASFGILSSHPMPRRRRILISLILLTGLGLALWWWTGREPSYQGRKLSEWCDRGIKLVLEVQPGTGSNLLDQLPAMRFETERAGVSNAICQIGDRALPWLVTWGNGRGSTWADWLFGHCHGKLAAVDAWLEARSENRIRETGRARFIAWCLKDKAVAAVPELMTDPLRHRASWEIIALVSRIGPSALPSIVPLLSDASPEKRELAREIAAAWGTNSMTAGPVIGGQFEVSHDSSQRFDLGATLIRIGYRKEEAIRYFKELLNSPVGTTGLPLEVFRLAGDIGATNLAETLCHPDPRIRRATFIVLMSPPLWDPNDWERFQIRGHEEIYEQRAWSVERTSFMEKTLEIGGRQAKIACLSEARDWCLSHENLADENQRQASLHFFQGFTNDHDSLVAVRASEILDELCRHWNLPRL